MWIGDFVRGHSIIRVLKDRWPERPVDLLTSSLCAPLVEYLPGVRKGIVWDLPRGAIPIGQYRALAGRLRQENYGTALVMLRTWKSALAPFLAGIPERTGFLGEGRVVLLNDIRHGERKLERMIDCMGTLALPRGTPLPAEWPEPQIVVPRAKADAWRAQRGLTTAGRIVALAPGAVGPGKQWPTAYYTEVARALASDGITVWVLGGPSEKPLAAEIAAAGPHVVDLTGGDLGNAVIALSLADAAVTNDSGLMHIAAALGTKTVAVFGPTSPRLWGPLNPLAAALEPPGEFSDVKQRRSADVAPERVIAALRDALG